MTCVSSRWIGLLLICILYYHIASKLDFERRRFGELVTEHMMTELLTHKSLIT